MHQAVGRLIQHSINFNLLWLICWRRREPCCHCCSAWTRRRRSGSSGPSSGKCRLRWRPLSKPGWTSRRSVSRTRRCRGSCRGTRSSASGWRRPRRARPRSWRSRRVSAALQRTRCSSKLCKEFQPLEAHTLNRCSYHRPDVLIVAQLQWKWGIKAVLIFLSLKWTKWTIKDY